MNERHFRLYERIVAIEDSLEALGPIDKLIERIEELEKMVKQTKTVLGFDEACKYIGVSESLLYKLTAAKEVPPQCVCPISLFLFSIPFCYILMIH